MNTTPGTFAPKHSIRYYRQKEKTVFQSIPGMRELQNAADENSLSDLQALYPDAAFALMMASNLFCRDKELNSIHLKAYRAILDGEPISNVRYRYDYDLECYLERHLWDD